LDKSRAQEKVFSGITANGQLGREQQSGAVCIGLARSVDDLAGIARHVTHTVVELGNADFQ